MQVFHYNNHNNYDAIEIAKKMLAATPDYVEAGAKKMSYMDRMKFTIERWDEMNPEAYKDHETRAILKMLCTALAYMGDFCAAVRMEMLSGFDAKYAKERGDDAALARAKEEQVFWQTVLYTYANEKSESVHLAYWLLYGMGCERDVNRAKKIYEKSLFEKYDSLDEANRERLRGVRDGKYVCRMSETRSRTIDALLSGDHALFQQVFDTAVAQGTEQEVDCVWGLMSYLDKLKEKAR